MTTIICIIAVVLIVALIALVAILIEKRDFNNGYCRSCGTKLRLFDYDSHGGRGYICDDCGHPVWVSYDVVDKDWEASK